LWFDKILLKLKSDENILVVAHGNSLRAIVKMIKGLSSEEVLKLNIPTGVPYIFQFNNKFELISDRYLGDDENSKKKQN
jgi:2,3-bisphosphoglycerate-dependent phosphoglycerate mutase